MILIAYGTRPEWLKAKSIIAELKKNNFEYRILFTGQHQDLVKEMCPDFTLNMGTGVNRLDTIVASIMNHVFSINTLAASTELDYVLVQGDTTSAMAVALSAFHHGIKVIHLEAGLRTYDRKNPYPEEINRQLISRIADIHLCPTELAKQNLINEGIKNNIFVVGNTVIDNLLNYKDKCEYTNKILITMHRRENHSQLEEWFTEMNILAFNYPEYEFILPIHPNPNVQKYKYLLNNINVIDPLPYEKMLDLLVKTRLVITDSGGLQEECSFFNKKCLTCRIITERPEAIEESTFLVKSPNELSSIFEKHINNFEINFECPFGDGHAAEKIVKILDDIMK